MSDSTGNLEMLNETTNFPIQDNFLPFDQSHDSKKDHRNLFKFKLYFYLK